MINIEGGLHIKSLQALRDKLLRKLHSVTEPLEISAPEHCNSRHRCLPRAIFLGKKKKRHEQKQHHIFQYTIHQGPVVRKWVSTNREINF